MELRQIILSGVFIILLFFFPPKHSSPLLPFQHPLQRWMASHSSSFLNKEKGSINLYQTCVLASRKLKRDHRGVGLNWTPSFLFFSSSVLSSFALFEITKQSLKSYTISLLWYTTTEIIMALWYVFLFFFFRSLSFFFYKFLRRLPSCVFKKPSVKKRNRFANEESAVCWGDPTI